MKRNGMPDVWEYKVVEHVRAHKHIYKVAKVKLADGTFVSTMEFSHEVIKNKRKKLICPIIERIHHKVIMLLGGTKAMANGLMKKVATYKLNQWSSLRNILKDGSVRISNNLCEQRMKPVKLLLKNCMNIGIEVAAKNSAFIFSLIESCKLNDIDPHDYMKHLFECILNGKDCDKNALLPCFYKSKC